MTIQPLTGILIGLVFLETVVVMGGWHYLTKGTWVSFPAGRVLMRLLAVMAGITALATASSFFPAFVGRPYVYIVLYALLIVVMGSLGLTIITEQRNRGPKP